MNKNEIKVGDTVAIGSTAWEVVEREGFTVGLVPLGSSGHRVQHVDVSMVKKTKKAA